jgi:hypothetical protein
VNPKRKTMFASRADFLDTACGSYRAALEAALDINACKGTLRTNLHTLELARDNFLAYLDLAEVKAPGHLFPVEDSHS